MLIDQSIKQFTHFELWFHKNIIPQFVQNNNRTNSASFRNFFSNNVNNVFRTK